jgi:hypothetical protein
MGTTARRKYIEVPNDYWETSCKDILFIMKESNAKTTKRNK